jgi:hypothetical protein
MEQRLRQWICLTGNQFPVHGGLRQMIETIRNIAEIGFGVVYSIGAIFNSVYTFKHGEEFFGSFARGAWLPPAGSFVSKVVIPNAKVFTGLLIAFQVSVAVGIFSRGLLATYALYAGTVFCVVAALVSNVGGAIANLLMAVIQFILAFAR